MFAFSGFSSMSDMDIYLRTPFLRVLLRLTVSNIVGVSSEFFQSLPRYLAWISSSVWFIDGVSVIRSCCWVSLLIHYSVGGLLSLGGLQSSWKYWFALVSGVPGSLLPDFCFPHPLTNKVPMGRFTSLRQDFGCIHLSSFSVSRRG